MSTLDGYRLVRAAGARGTAALKRKVWTQAERERCHQRALRLGTGDHLRGRHPLAWEKGEPHLLGKLPDDEVARSAGRTYDAVRFKRTKLGINNPRDRRKRESRP